MTSPEIVLHQFPASHFNEKARWALDWKGLPHRRVSYLPGPHAPQIRRLSGQTATPVLELDGERIAGSARILAALERRFPERPLYPADPELRRRALALEEEFDREVGPAVRTAVFSVLIAEPAYLCRVFARARAAPLRALYRASFPLVRGLVARANGTTDPRGVERAFERSLRALDFVAASAGPSGALVGDRFGVADLGCAALLAPLASPAHPDTALPAPMPPRVRDFLDRWRGHAGTRWVHEQYARHRAVAAAPSDPGSAFGGARPRG